MKLYLLRHAPAVERGRFGHRPDHERPLTPAGIREMKGVAAAMCGLGLEFDVILTSPFVRARQTADLVAAACGAENKLTETPHLASGASASQLIRQIAALPPGTERVLLVGHEPDLSNLISLLLTGGPGLALNFKKSGLCKLTVERLKAGRCATLNWLLTPRLMLAMRQAF